MQKDEHYEILLIEDSDVEAELTFKALRIKMPHIQFKQLRDGEEALDFIFARGDFESRKSLLPPLLILLDLDIPKLNGLDVLKEIKHHEQTRFIPTVVLTVSNNPELMKEAYLAGANSFIIKPMSYVKYSLAIAEVGHYWLSVNEHPNLGSLKN